MNTFQLPPQQKPAPKPQQVKLRDLVDRWDWFLSVPVEDNGGTRMETPAGHIAAGALMKLLDELKHLCAHARGTNARLDILLDALKPAPPEPVPSATQIRKTLQLWRESESRRRAWEAYKRAGGTMEPEGDCAPGDALRTLGLTVRARKAFQRLGCETVGDVLNYTANDLLALKNFGKSSLEDVRARLRERGLKLKGD